VRQVSRNALCPCGSGVKYKKCCGAVQQPPLGKPRSDQDAIIVCMPVRDQVCYETYACLRDHLKDVAHCVLTVGRKPVDVARNTLAKRALEIAKNNPFPFTPKAWFVLWADADAWWAPGSVSVMLRAMNELQAQGVTIDALFGYFSARQPYEMCAAVQKAGDLLSAPTFRDFAQGALVPVEGAGFHFVLTRLSLLERIGPNPFSAPFEGYEHEDGAFCARARAIGATLVVGMGFSIGHIAPDLGAVYFPAMPAMMMAENENNGQVYVEQLALEHMLPNGLIVARERRNYGPNVHGTSGEKRLESMRAEMERRKQVAGGAT